MLAWRLAISAVLIPALFGLFRLDHRTGGAAWPLLLLCLGIACRGVYELVDLLRAREFAVSLPLTTGLTCLVVASGWAHLLVAGTGQAHPGESPAGWGAAGPVAAAWGVSLLALFLAAIVRYREPGRTIETLGAEFLVVSYLGGLLAITAQLRWVAGAQAGYLALGSLLIGTKGGDIGAYTLGRLFGRRKMAPRLSPGKTWAGALGAVLFAAAGTWAFLRIATSLFDEAWASPAWPWSVLYGAVLGGVGLLGDLAESLIKRDVGRKDASALMPGFGGLLDLIDSVIFAGPVAWALWIVLPLR